MSSRPSSLPLARACVGHRLPADLGIKTELLCQEVHAKMWGIKIFYEPETGMVDRVLRRDPTEGRRRVLDLGQSRSPSSCRPARPG